MKNNITQAKIPETFDPEILMKHIQIPEVTVTGEATDRSEDRKRLAGVYTNIGNVQSGSSEDFKDLPDLESIIKSIRMPTKIVRILPVTVAEPVLWYYFTSPALRSFSEVGERVTSPLSRIKVPQESDLIIFFNI